MAFYRNCCKLYTELIYTPRGSMQTNILFLVLLWNSKILRESSSFWWILTVCSSYMHRDIYSSHIWAYILHVVVFTVSRTEWTHLVVLENRLCSHSQPHYKSTHHGSSHQVQHKFLRLNCNCKYTPAFNYTYTTTINFLRLTVIFKAKIRVPKSLRHRPIMFSGFSAKASLFSTRDIVGLISRYFWCGQLSEMAEQRPNHIIYMFTGVKELSLHGGCEKPRLGLTNKTLLEFTSSDDIYTTLNRQKVWNDKY